MREAIHMDEVWGLVPDEHQIKDKWILRCGFLEAGVVPICPGITLTLLEESVSGGEHAPEN